MNMQTSQLTQLYCAVWFGFDSFQCYFQYLRLFFSFVNETTHTLATSVVSGVCGVRVFVDVGWEQMYTNSPWMEHWTKTNQMTMPVSQSNKMEMCQFVCVVEMSWSFSFVNCRFKCESREKSEFTQNTLSFCLSRVFFSLQLTRSHFCELSTQKNWLVTHLFSSVNQISQSK